ncbi:hypothetical protein Kpol_1065p18 [Vanderwaltozyma polyspora DSM 70294]|uniref:Chitobiosyldiphosphodolichol beta-mannosyltransferase n=1 Tax=Vanderwaltozyma polyspora (strain ATCC 22028 / DSM 70294 / BCRC 21397 / CBS 2163 / NBRC 10782 / NRRL Y-8283 / UCD 57-17) TaxID=436907 RepID=A7TL40_VANPO|nr:uncharacterized protein Kpol_1065p18 [Vanderwaltozyma polyspora DSM 70294]EDO17003.1 hypothetical protein Kpol_1065p18 [Vanderwaltozyma polyspora DSM 70294]
MIWSSDISQWLLVLLIVYLSLTVWVYYVMPFLLVGTKSIKKRIIIYVIGDIGHSPRMCNHAISFSENGWQVELCGYVNSNIPARIIDDSNITIHELPQLTNSSSGKILFMIKKVLFQIVSILRHLWELRGSDIILVQNPPTIPILPIVAFYRLTGCKLMVDWHNLGYSILQLKFNNNFYHPLVLISFVIEYIFSKSSDYNLTVTESMKDYLVNNFGLKKSRCYVLYDRPGLQFSPFQGSLVERNDKIQSEPYMKNLVPLDFDLTKGDKLIVTSTSFTPDEDIGILIGSLKIYESSYQKFDNNLPKILCVITGKGPMKEEIMKQVSDYKWNRCTIQFAWLSSEDYPKLLRLCDYGVSLHSSSSGLDLPMKILDMFGSGLPVLALNYPVLDELVTHKENGLKFADRRELHESLIFAMKDAELYEVLKENVLQESSKNWDSSWKPVMKKLNLIR